MSMSSDATASTGLTGGYWAPIPYSWPYPARKGSARRKTRETEGWRILSSIVGRIDLYLEGSGTETPKEGAAGWLAHNLGLFAKQTERYSIKEFLKKYSTFLSDTGLRNALLMEIDYEQVYADRENKDPDDLDNALTKAYEYVSGKKGANKVLLSTYGRTRNGSKNGLEVTVEAQYNRKHGHGKPSIEIRVLGIPSVLVRQAEEGDRQYKTRIERLFRELRRDVAKAKFARKYENTAKLLLRDYERRLKKVLDVSKTTRWLHLDWGRIEQKAKPRLKF